ncbi:MAG: anhydro-N-acetylmuramic acid kinase [Campylobacterales bacterium]|nr:anhydro-N-acetylmuramic acid kinase [Campylobacterales bacterium]
MNNGEFYIGVMSGTSMDGIDVALCQIDKKECMLIDSQEYPFSQALKAHILQMISGQTTLEEVGEIDHVLGLEFAAAVNALIVKSGVAKEKIKAIGLHGQTLWHAPQGKYPMTIQLGDPNIITVLIGIPVVADFRRKDIALGGQGAPFAPAFHAFIFNNIKEGVAVVNIGGIANITVLGEKLIGYDTGPGNVLMDMWASEYLNRAYDENGTWARSGKVLYRLLDCMLEDDYFKRSYPKSTGREKFNRSWLDVYLSDGNYKPEDIQRTLIELTALSIANEVLRFQRDVTVLCGGGAKNVFLVERIKVLIPNIEVVIAQNGDMLEAMMMAWLAYKRIHNEHVDLKNVTGATRNAILGGIYA